MDIHKLLKGQGATEYIVLLAIVLIIVLVVVGLLGFFPSFSSGTQASESQSYWSSASPIAIINAQENTTGASQVLTLIMENHGSQVLTLTSVTATHMNGSFAVNASPISFAPGARTTITFTNSTINCTAVGSFNPVSVNMVYTDESIAGKVEKGAKPLYVSCGQ